MKTGLALLLIAPSALTGCAAMLATDAYLQKLEYIPETKITIVSAVPSEGSQVSMGSDIEVKTKFQAGEWAPGQPTYYLTACNKDGTICGKALGSSHYYKLKRWNGTVTLKFPITEALRIADIG